MAMAATTTPSNWLAGWLTTQPLSRHLLSLCQEHELQTQAQPRTHIQERVSYSYVLGGWFEEGMLQHCKTISIL